MSAQTYLHIFSEEPPHDSAAALKHLLQLTGARLFFVNIVEGEQHRMIKNAISSRAVCNLLSPERILHIDAGACALAETILRQMKESIDIAIRGRNLLANVAIKFGKHHLKRWNHFKEKPEKVRHPHAQITIWGYETPNNWPVYEKAIVKLPIVEQLVTEMGRVFEKTKTCFSYKF
jgi:hypothetical protein